MRIGLFTASQWSQDEDPKTILADLRQQVRTARQNGFSSLLLGQHVLSGPMGMFQTMPLLGQIADDAAGMQIGPGVLLLSMMNPVLAAEEGATIDWLCDGNYVLAAGLEIEISFLDCFFLVPPVILAMTLPISIAGWGVREGAMIVALGLIGVSQESALVLSILFGLGITLAALPGGVIWLFSRNRTVPAMPDGEAES